jgi:uncharacterized protein YigE (DUF2233 family)
MGRMAPTSIRLLATLTLGLALLCGRAAADPCRSESFEGSTYTVCSFDLTESDVRVFWQNGEGEPYASFNALARDLQDRGQTLAFAMNGGMYDAELRPVGLYVEDGSEMKAANTADAAGNFHMKPNGVFYLAGRTAGVMETEAFLKARPAVDFATQSGPMLVIDGTIHPRFIPGSPYRKRRNGVGVSSPTNVHFAISDGVVNFDEFARFFRDKLGCRNALFLDGGAAPGLYAPELGRNDAWSRYGPIIAVVE